MSGKPGECLPSVGFEYLTFSRGARLITGDEMAASLKKHA